jgi:hypothetical protein
MAINHAPRRSDEYTSSDASNVVLHVVRRTGLSLNRTESEQN